MTVTANISLTPETEAIRRKFFSRHGAFSIWVQQKLKEYDNMQEVLVVTPEKLKLAEEHTGRIVRVLVTELRNEARGLFVNWERVWYDVKESYRQAGIKNERTNEQLLDIAKAEILKMNTLKR